MISKLNSVNFKQLKTKITEYIEPDSCKNKNKNRPAFQC